MYAFNLFEGKSDREERSSIYCFPVRMGGMDVESLGKSRELSLGSHVGRVPRTGAVLPLFSQVYQQGAGPGAKK